MNIILRLFLNHSKAKFWSNNNSEDINKITCGSGKKCWFNCNICTHEFSSIIKNITRNNSWCPYCSNQKLCKNKLCLICYKKSFQNNPKVKNWSIKNNQHPRMGFNGTTKK